MVRIATVAILFSIAALALAGPVSAEPTASAVTIPCLGDCSGGQCTGPGCSGGHCLLHRKPINIDVKNIDVQPNGVVINPQSQTTPKGDELSDGEKAAWIALTVLVAAGIAAVVQFKNRVGSSRSTS
jgi:hypothetical protein